MPGRLSAIITVLNVALLVTSNAAGAKMIALPSGLAASATVIPYIVSFLVIDLINELFRESGARPAAHIGLGAVVLSTVLISLAVYAPAAQGW